ncbi:hypothetical protein MNBD_GAMMA25-119 [hydrothermal vent metagenome]|uniref:MalT-like winged helix domain-containing protein n=1 Tax=hydrothermal vent metagenome TaxID=652676 RepID=A0A3B1BRW7_9ZZZZ
MSLLYFPPKVCPPRLNEIYPRKRLIKSLQEKQNFPVIWISSPAGSGKTSLISSYAQSTNRPLIWYRFDEGDSDIGSFFHYLILAYKCSHRLSRIKLAPFTPEYDNGLTNFSRSFFREFYTCCKPGSILVFDDYHLVSAKSDLHRIMQIAISEIPEGLNIIISGRHAPPLFVSSLISRKQLALLDWSQLKFIKSEIDDVLGFIVGADNMLPTDALREKIYMQTDGWITGIILLLESRYSHDSNATNIDISNINLVFEYFSAEIESHIGEDVLNFLSQVALMPVITAENAVKLTANNQAVDILDTLSKQYLFIRRFGILKTSYEFNPLFREYLLQQLNIHHNNEKIKALKAIAGYLLLKSNYIDEAARVFIESNLWIKLENLIISNAKKYIEQGRHSTIEVWIKNIPKEIVARKPWLLFWFGNSILQTKPLEARVILEQAYVGFLRIKDKKGLYLCWANIIDSFIFGWDTFSPIAGWLDKLDYLQSHYPGIPGIEIKARVYVAVFTAMLHACPDHDDFPLWLKKMENIFRFVRIDLIRALVGSQLSFYYMLVGDMVKFSTTVFSIASLKRADNLPALPRLLTAISEINFYIYSGELDKADMTLEYALNLAEEKGVCLFDNLLLTLKVHLHGTKQEVDKAESYLEKFTLQLKEERVLDHAYSLFLSTWLNLMRGNIELAYHQSCEHEKSIKQLCFFYPIMLADLLHAQVLIKCDKFEKAEEHLDACLSRAIKSKTMLIQFMCISTQVYLLLKINHKNADHIQEQLKNAFSIGRQQNIFFTPIWNTEIMEIICRYALENNVEEVYTNKLMEKHAYLNVSSAPERHDFKWAVKIFTFGGLVIEVNGETYKNRSKVKSKPLQLLKVLLSSEFCSLPQSRVCELLWPDAEGDFAHQNMKTTLFRLRKILGSNSILLKEGSLSLNRETVWVDSLVLDDLLRHSIKYDNMDELYRSVCELHQGDFLAEEDARWVFSARDKYKSKLIDLVTEYSNFLIDENRLPEAINVYKKGLCFDSSPEKIYSGLLKCCMQLERYEDAEKIFKQYEANTVQSQQDESSSYVRELYLELENKRARQSAR